MYSIKNNDDSFLIELELGNICNFKCSYCFPGSNTGDRMWPDVNKLERGMLHLLKQHNRKTRLYLIGGEPTLWKDLPQFCNNLKMAHDVIINISTNASQSLRWWKQHAHCFDIVNISLHHEYSKIQHTINVADILYEKNIEVNIDVLIDPNDVQQCMDIVERVKQSKHKFPIIAKTVIIAGAHNYSDDEVLEYLEQPIKRMPDMDWYNSVCRKPRTHITIDNNIDINNDNYFLINNLNHFKGWMCNLGVDTIKIRNDGTINGNCGTELNRNIYNLQDFKITPIKCNQDVCPCSGESCTTKWNANA